MRLLSLAGLALALAMPVSAQRSARRAILVSFDGFSEQWMRAYADPSSTPALQRMFARGVCADVVRPAFPSVTPTSHAAIWTGAYSNVNGVSASANAALPWPEKSLLETTDGYKATALRAEPIWISAARQGRTVWSHMATQSPQAPAYLPITRSTPELDSARASAARANVLPNLAAVNTYNDLVEPARMIRSRAELSWAFGKSGDSLHARIVDDSTVRVSLGRTGSRGVTVRLAPTDTTSPRNRALARHFSPPLRVDLPDGRRTFVYFRLWELARDGSRLMLFVSEARVLQANRPDVAAAYDSAVQGVPGNGATKLMERGELGPRAHQGGSGIAELRYLETAELVTRQFLRGSEWGWKTYHPALMTDYLPYPDEVLHQFLAFAEPSTPGVAPAVRDVARRMLARGYMLADRHLARLERFAAQDRGSTRLFVTGEHGMRATWMSLRPNIILRDAGLLAADSAGVIDLSRTSVLWTPGAWFTVNTTAHKGGIVSPDSAGAVLARVETLMRGVRDSAGRPIVTRFFRSNTAEGDSLGIGGAGGGDLYVDLAPGYYWSASARGSALAPMTFPMGEHGFPSVDRDMQPALCIGNAGAPRRIGNARSIDIAPTISQWLGITPPREATGRPLLPR